MLERTAPSAPLGTATTLGTATLLVGDYHSANFFFRRASNDDTEGDDGAILAGHTALLRGTAERGDSEWSFTVLLDSPEDRQLVGAPFDHHVKEDEALTLGVRLLVQDPIEGDTLFDEVDFTELPTDSEYAITIAPAALDEATLQTYNHILRRFQTHDHFDIQVQKD